MVEIDAMLKVISVAGKAIFGQDGNSSISIPLLLLAAKCNFIRQNQILARIAINKAHELALFFFEEDPVKLLDFVHAYKAVVEKFLPEERE